MYYWHVEARLLTTKPEQSTQVYSAWARPLWAGWNEYPTKSSGSKQAHPVVHQPVSVASQCGAGAGLKGLASGDQRWPMGSSSTLEVCYTIQVHIYSTLLYNSDVRKPQTSWPDDWVCQEYWMPRETLWEDQEITAGDRRMKQPVSNNHRNMFQT